MYIQRVGHTNDKDSNLAKMTELAKAKNVSVSIFDTNKDGEFSEEEILSGLSKLQGIHVITEKQGDFLEEKHLNEQNQVVKKVTYSSKREIIIQHEYTYNAQNKKQQVIAKDGQNNIVFITNYEYGETGKISKSFSLDANGNIVVARYYNLLGNEICEEKFVYNKENQKISCVRKAPNNKILSTINYEYNEDGQLVFTTTTKNGNSIKEEYFYDERKQNTEIIKKDSNNIVLEEQSLVYDLQGRHVKTVFKDNQGNVTKTTEFEYDTSSVKTKAISIVYDEQGNEIKSEEIVFNSDNNQLITEKDKDGKILKEIRATYNPDNSKYSDEITLYDENGNCVGKEEHFYFDGQLIRQDIKTKDGKLIESKSFKYNEFGKKQAEYFVSYNEKGLINYKLETIYDAKNRIIEQIKKGKFSELQEKTQFKYDKQSNLIGEIKIIYNKDEKVEFVFDSIYENGLKTNTHKKDATGNLLASTDYEYDEKGEKVKEITNAVDKNGKVKNTETTNYSNGLITKYSYFVNEYSRENKIIEYFYDENKNKTKEIMISTPSYEKLRTTTYYKDGKIDKIIVTPSWAKKESYEEEIIYVDKDGNSIKRKETLYLDGTKISYFEDGECIKTMESHHRTEERLIENEDPSLTGALCRTCIDTIEEIRIWDASKKETTFIKKRIDGDSSVMTEEIATEKYSRGTKIRTTIYSDGKQEIEKSFTGKDGWLYRRTIIENGKQEIEEYGHEGFLISRTIIENGKKAIFEYIPDTERKSSFNPNPVKCLSVTVFYDDKKQFKVRGEEAIVLDEIYLEQKKYPEDSPVKDFFGIFTDGKLTTNSCQTVGNCLLHAHINAILQTPQGRAHLNSLITKMPDGTIEVRLPGAGKKYRFYEDQLIRNFGTTCVGDGDYTALMLALEKYIKEVRGDETATTDNVLPGGHPMKCIEIALFGARFTLQDDINYEEMKTDFLNNKVAITCGLDEEKCFPNMTDEEVRCNVPVYDYLVDEGYMEGIYGSVDGKDELISINHAYAVTDMDDDTVTLIDSNQPSKRIKISKDIFLSLMHVSTLETEDITTDPSLWNKILSLRQEFNYKIKY